MQPTPLEISKRRLNRLTHRVYTLPVLVLMPHSRCNCRCVMCDIWKANQNRQELTRADLEKHLAGLRRLGVRHVLLSGGEPLMHTNLWQLCELLRELPARISLLSTGLLLKQHAREIVGWTDEVIVSLDGSQAVHDLVRDIPHAYTRLAEGVQALKTLDPGFRVTGRATIQRANYFDLPGIIQSAQAIGLDQISFLAVDVSSQAFNRAQPWDRERAAQVALDPRQVEEFKQVLEQTISRFAPDFATGFIAESPQKLRRLAVYFDALNGQADFPANTCNAPWISTVVEADGTVRPCFFHPPVGDLRQGPLEAILNSERAIAFRRQLDVRTDPVCKKCVCTLNLSSRASFERHGLRTDEG
jgi:MoaA/NifB/PqqE/SkfB family radical SAM enzyme